MSGKRPFVTEWRLAIRDDERLSPNAKLIGFVLTTYMNGEGRANPSVATLARKAGRGRRCAQYALVELSGAGYLSAQGNKGTSNQYTGLLPDLCTVVHTPPALHSGNGNGSNGLTHEARSTVKRLVDEARRKQIAANDAYRIKEGRRLFAEEEAAA